jgi:hypothetical protein
VTGEQKISLKRHREEENMAGAPGKGSEPERATTVLGLQLPNPPFTVQQ